jgi:hypothetical protein
MSNGVKNPNPNDPQNPAYGVGGFGSGQYGNQPVENMELGYYTGLVTSQYQLPNSPKFNAFLYALLRKLDDVSQCLVQMDEAFDLDVAVGPQLNALGAIAGVSRTVPFQPSNGVSPVLDDNTYQILIKATIARNQWNGTITGMQPIWQSLFPGGRIVIADNQNMTANIILSGSFTSIIQDLITHDMIVPRPQGVLYNFEVGNLPKFGADRNDSYVAGADLGYTV